MDDPIDTYLRALGRRIAEVRRTRELTQEALAVAVDVTEKYVQFIERGRANPTTKLLMRIAIALGVEPIELFMPPSSTESTRTGRPPRQRTPS